MATRTIVDDNDVKADPGQLESRVVHQIGMGKLDAAAAEGSSGQLQRSLNSRQIGMFSIAGSIGTGLLIATGSTLASGGPGSMLISMIVLGLVCYNVLAAYGEMSTAFPMDRGFSGYATRFVDPAYG